MNKTKLISFSNYDVYLVIDDNLTYYISIPKLNMFENIITVELNKGAYILNNSIEEINDSLKNLYTDFNNTNSILVIPSFEKETYLKLNDKSNIELFNKVGKYITKTINSAHQILKDANLKINSNIKFLNDDNEEFIDWFIDKYKTRIQKMSIIDILNEFSLGKSVVAESEDLKKVNAGGLNFIIGNNSEVSNNITKLEEIQNPYDEYSELYKEEPKRRDLATAAGNISYYFIRTMVLVTLLIILVLVIKH